MEGEKEWFSTWFSSPYYPILYKNRDHEEAKQFLNRLTARLELQPEEHKILDLACGRGRHSIYLNRKGFEVCGLDLSEESITEAKKFENERLHFHVHDMRKPFAEESYDVIFNLFTSFGYFENEEENRLAIASVAKALRRGGTLVLDFFNTSRTVRKLIPYEEKEIEGILFKITKHLSDGFIVKEIDFEDKGQSYHFEERVKAVKMSDFLDYFESAGLIVDCAYGDYELRKFDPQRSDRMIFVTTKG